MPGGWGCGCCDGDDGGCGCHVQAGTNITITGTGSATDPWIINATASGVVDSVTGSAQIDVDNTNPANPVVHTFNVTLGQPDELVEQLQAGTGISINNANPRQPIITASGSGTAVYTEVIQTGAYTFVLSDATGLVVEVLNDAANAAFNIPLHSAVAWPVGCVINLLSINTGLLSITGSVGITLQSPYGKVQLATQYARATLINRAVDVWSLEGDLA